MSKKPPTSPDLPPDQINQNPPAEPREDVRTAEETAVADLKHRRAGVVDPMPSVRKAFAEHAAITAEDEDAEPEYRGPWVVNNKFPMTDDAGNRTMVKPTQPLPGGGRGRRILEVGDIPDKLAQELWANGAISPKPVVAPKPRRPRV